MGEQAALFELAGRAWIPAHESVSAKGRPYRVSGHWRNIPKTATEENLTGIGDCYQSALDNMIGMSVAKGDARLVHAIVTGRGPVEGLHFGHAWIEVGPKDVREAIDRSNGLDVRMPAIVYRALGNAKNVREYTFQEAAKLAVESGTYGPWE